MQNNLIIYKSQLITNNHKQFIEECYFAYDKISNKLNTKETTWTYREYNLFSIMSGSILFYKLFSELQKIIKAYHLKDSPLWMQSWLNFHKSNEVLDWHNHEWPFHGYISIDPKSTTTVFKEYEVKNEIGNIYIGPGNILHKVRVDEEYSSPRITIGFDVTDEAKLNNNMFSLIPIL
jgi:hypothetical protein